MLLCCCWMVGSTLGGTSGVLYLNSQVSSFLDSLALFTAVRSLITDTRVCWNHWNFPEHSVSCAPVECRAHPSLIPFACTSKSRPVFLWGFSLPGCWSCPHQTSQDRVRCLTAPWVHSHRCLWWTARLAASLCPLQRKRGALERVRKFCSCWWESLCWDLLFKHI